MIPLADLRLERADIDAVLQVMESGWLTTGAVCADLEARFAAQIGAGHAVAVTNGTAALHLALLAAGVVPGDEVICPSLSFVATANAVRYCGAKPVFADIVDPESDLNMDPDAVESLIGPATRAILVMHYGGYACNFKRMTTLARQHGVALIEDAAHAPGAGSEGRSCGTWGLAGCFSFFSNKNITSGEGGMVTTDSEEVAHKVRSLRSHAMTAPTLDRHLGRAYSYDVDALGFNYRLDEMRAALARAQLTRLDEWNHCRRRLTRLYRRRLAALDGITVPFADGEVDEASCHLLPVMLPAGTDRADLMARMRRLGVQTSNHYPAIHRFTEYRRHGDLSLPRTEAAADRQLTLPLYPSMGPERVERVVAVLEEALEQSCRHLAAENG